MAQSPHVLDVLIDPAFNTPLVDEAAIEEQVRYLCAHLAPERNHRTLALYAIFLAAVVFPELTDAAQWRRFALSELVRNVEQDLLADGVQCEQSTDYHHIVLRNYLSARRLAALYGATPPDAFVAAADRTAPDRATSDRTAPDRAAESAEPARAPAVVQATPEGSALILTLVRERYRPAIEARCGPLPR